MGGVEHVLSIHLSRVHLDGGTEAVEAEGSVLSVRLIDHLGNEVLDLGELLVKAHTIHEGVVGDEVDDVLSRLHVHLATFNGKSLSLADEIVPGLGNGSLVGLPGIGPLSFHVGRLGFLECSPFFNDGIVDLVEGELGKVSRHDERNAAIVVDLEHILSQVLHVAHLGC